MQKILVLASEGTIQNRDKFNVIGVINDIVQLHPFVRGGKYIKNVKGSYNCDE